MTDAVAVQRDYYRRTAESYDALHVAAEPEHNFALAVLLGLIPHLGVESVLDVGSGTGRALLGIQTALPHVRTVGIEPVAELRAIGYSKGLRRDSLIRGDAMRLDFPDASFDLVCEFGILHHLENPSQAVSEMLRVARRAIFMSDSNNFGQGGFFARTLKQLLRSIGLWKPADYLKTRGRGYTISEGDGLAYSYSVFSTHNEIRRQCRVHLFNTVAAGPNLYRSASHVALLGIKPS